MNLSTTQNICNRCIRSLNPDFLRYLRTTSSLSQRRQYTSKPISQDGRPFRLAVIGSGPAGFYTAYKVMAKLKDAKIDMYEHLPTPFGLVRYGVAPDHPEVKNCQEKFQEIAESPNFNFIGNINIGSGPSSLPLKTIIPHYDAILFAYGASKDKKLGIPGEKMKGIYSARAFVGWYNGLPEYADLNPDLSNAHLAAIIGQGNVALDVARILLSDVDALRKTDITEEALEVLSKSRVSRVKVLGRRGPSQAAFTIKEIRELLNLPNAVFQPIKPSLLPPKEILKTLPRPQRRILEVLQKGSAVPFTPSTMMNHKTWSLDFLLTPTLFGPARLKSQLLDPLHSSGGDDSSILTHITCECNKFQASLPEDEKKVYLNPRARVAGMPLHTTHVPADVAFRSIGYKSEALSGFEDLAIPFDEQRGIFYSDNKGRLVQPATGPSIAEKITYLPGMYCAGWVKRGPTGVIANTMADAFESADAIIQDWSAKNGKRKPTGLEESISGWGSGGEGGEGDILRFLEGGNKDGWEGVRREAEKRGCRKVSWGDWKRIDEEERRKGASVGKERVKFRRVEDMLAVLD